MVTRGIVVAAVIAVGVHFGYAPGIQVPVSDAQTVASSKVEIGQVAPDDVGQLALAAAPALSPAQLEQLQIRKLQMREQMIARVDSNQANQAGLPLVAGPAANVVRADEAQFPGNPALTIIGRNNRNTNANNPAKGSTLAEPAAANNSRRVFAAGNFNHAEVSTNGGATWADVPLPAGPAAAPIVCCDHDVVIDDASRITFHSTLYINAAVTTGEQPPVFSFK